MKTRGPKRKEEGLADAVSVNTREPIREKEELAGFSEYAWTKKKKEGLADAVLVNMLEPIRKEKDWQEVSVITSGPIKVLSHEK